MPTVSIANFENEELLSTRLLSFMANNEQTSIACESNSGISNKFLNSTSFGSSVTSLIESELNGNNIVRSPLHRNGSITTSVTPHERLFNGSASDVLVTNNPAGFISGSCTPPPSSAHPASNVSTNYFPVRNHPGAPPYSALTSPCLSNKMNSGAGVQQLLGYNNGNVPGECHSLQNSPFYNHYPLSGNLQTQLHRQLGGISPGPIGALLSNGVSTLNTTRAGLYQEVPFPLNGSLHPLNSNSTGCPQRELFPTASQSGGQGASIFGSGLLMQDRLHYYALAQKHGFIVGSELERVKENSCRSTSQSYGRIAAHFRHRYGETEAKTKAAYLQIGVRVPSKDHVSEIVGKGGQKIKLIREETGALITTPGEHEEHVFIIEAPPEIAMRVAHHLTARAHEITQSKLAAGERRRGSTSSQPSSGLDSVLTGSTFNGSVHTNSSGHPSTGSTSSLITSNGNQSSCTIPPLSNSVTNSPLHPVGGSSTTTLLMSTSAGSTSLRTPNGSMFSQHLSSLPSSPCNPTTLSGPSPQNSLNGNGGPGSLFLAPNTPGSRVLLARSRISVPQDMVGKIIGTQGSIITTIQKDTGTEIKSPPKEAARGPNATSEFEISAYQGLGLSSNQAAECRVQQAKQLIGHLVMRQLERRASEEIDDASGSSNLSSDEQRLTNGNSGGTPRSSHAWMWPDVAQMDSQEAREVLDRILAESKNKTRRAKELAAAAAVSAGPSPTSNSQALANSTSVLTLSGSLTPQPVGLLGPDQQSQQSLHFHPQVLGSAALFDRSDANDCNDLAPQQLNDSNGSNLFGSQSNQFVKRTLSNGFPEDNHHSFNRVGQPCSPRTISGFHLPEQNDLVTAPFHRIVTNSNLGTDIWNYGSSSNRHLQNGSREINGLNQSQSVLGSGSGLNTFHASPPSSNPDNGFLRKQTSFSSGLVPFKGHLEDQPVTFNFADSGNCSGSGFTSGGDISPTLLMQCRSQQYPDHQPLTRRHSDWVVNTSNMLSDLSIHRQPIGGGQLGLLSDSDHHNASETIASGHFDFLKALDQLCLSSGTDNPSTDNGQITSPPHQNSPRGLSHCPPGFEPVQHQQILGTAEDGLFPVDKSDEVNIGEICVNSLGRGPWSNKETTSATLFMMNNSDAHSLSDSSHSNSASKISLLRRLFDGSQTGLGDTDLLANTHTNLNSIWSSTDAHTHLPNSDEALYTFSPYMEAATATLSDRPEDQLALKSDSVGLYSYMGSDVGQHCASSNEMTSRCGAIGEGRRRRRGQSPSISSDVDSVTPISVSSVITSITEVA